MGRGERDRQNEAAEVLICRYTDPERNSADFLGMDFKLSFLGKPLICFT